MSSPLEPLTFSLAACKTRSPTRRKSRKAEVSAGSGVTCRLHHCHPTHPFASTSCALPLFDPTTNVHLRQHISAHPLKKSTGWHSLCLCTDSTHSPLEAVPCQCANAPSSTSTAGPVVAHALPSHHDASAIDRAPIAADQDQLVSPSSQPWLPSSSPWPHPRRPRS